MPYVSLSRLIVKSHGLIACIIAACLAFGCSPPPRPTPYVASACPLPPGVQGYPVAAHDPAGRLDPATLSRIARAVAVSMAISHQQGESLPEDVAALAASLARNQPLSRWEWNPSATDTASIFIIYHGATPAPVIRSTRTQSESSEFTRRVLHSATLARDRAQEGKTQRDTLPLQLQLTDGDSAVVLVRFGSEPGPNDGAAHFAAQERDVWPLRWNRPPAYPSTLISEGVEGEVVVAFVLRPDSAPDMSTVRVLRSSHPYFTKSVLESLARSRYVPLELDCHVYPVLVQQPSVFRLRQ